MVTDTIPFPSRRKYSHITRQVCEVISDYAVYLPERTFVICPTYLISLSLKRVTICHPETKEVSLCQRERSIVLRRNHIEGN